MAIIRAIDHNKKLSTLELGKEEFAVLKEQAVAADISVEEAALILMTDGKTSRFKGTIYVDE